MVAAVHGEPEDLFEQRLQLLLCAVELRQDLLEEREIECGVCACVWIRGLFPGQIDEPGDLVGDTVSEVPMLFFQDAVELEEGLAGALPSRR